MIAAILTTFALTFWNGQADDYHISLEEDVGFEPTDPFLESAVFKTAAFSHSANLPHLVHLV